MKTKKETKSYFDSLLDELMDDKSQENTLKIVEQMRALNWVLTSKPDKPPKEEIKVNIQSIGSIETQLPKFGLFNPICKITTT